MQRFVLGLLSAVILGLGGWVIKIDRAVAAQEAKNDAVIERLDAMHVDIREIRDHLVRVLQGR